MRTYPRQSQSRQSNGRNENKRQEAPREQQPKHHNNGRGGNPRELHQKYLGLAREAIQSGDIVEAEQHFQYAEHYYRVMSERSSYTPPPQAAIPKPVENTPEPVSTGPVAEPVFNGPPMDIPPSQPL